MNHVSPTFFINLLKEHWNISNYRATLGYKINHSFTKQNAKYVSVIHPRFGPIVAAVSEKKIKKGEEILCSYGYYEDTIVPTWYAKVYQEELNHPWPGKHIYDENDATKLLFTF